MTTERPRPRTTHVVVEVTALDTTAVLEHSVDVAAVVLRPVRSGNALEGTVERLLAALRLGVIAEGRRLPAERELATRLAVSRMTLRDALKTLQDAGYVESRRGRNGGTFVTAEVASGRCRVARSARPSGAGLLDVLVLREVLEVGAATQAASVRQPAATRAHLLEHLSLCEGSAVNCYRAADSRLHLALAEATGSSALVAAIADARMRLNDLLDLASIDVTNPQRSNRQHQRIVEAILARDPVGAREAMAAHVGETATLLRTVLG